VSGSDAREKLASEGLRLFLRDGYAATGIQGIVAAAGVPKGSFYHFFPAGKESFAAAVVDRYAALAADVRKQILFEPGAPPLARLRAYFEYYAEHFGALGFREGCLLGNLSAEVADSSEMIRARIHAAFAAWEADLAQVIAEAIEQGALAPAAAPAQLARYLVQGWEGALLRMKSEKSAAALQEFIAATFDIFLAGRS
jgi:TetR/AcrR family transcriptional repressor of nem operon